MQTLLEVFAKAKDLPNMGQDETLIVMDGRVGLAIYNAKILDPYLSTLLVEVKGQNKAVHYTDVDAAKIQADFV